MRPAFTNPWLIALCALLGWFVQWFLFFWALPW